MSESLTDSLRDLKITEVLFHASVAISETQQVISDSKHGANYDTVYASNDLSTEQDYVFRPTGELIIEVGEALKLTCTAAANPVIGTARFTVKFYTEF